MWGSKGRDRLSQDQHTTRRFPVFVVSVFMIGSAQPLVCGRVLMRPTAPG